MVPLTLCCICNGIPARIRTLRRETPFWTRLKTAFGYPLTVTGVATLLILALLATLLGMLLGQRGQLVATAVIFAYVFHLARLSAAGTEDIEPPDFTSWDDLLRPALRAAWAVAIAWGPLALFLNLGPAPPPPPPPVEVTAPVSSAVVGSSIPGHAYNPMEEVFGYEALHPNAAPLPAEPTIAPQTLERLFSPLGLTLMAFGILLTPMLLLMAATESALVEFINPVELFGYARALGADYLLLTAVLFGLGSLFTIPMWLIPKRASIGVQLGLGSIVALVRVYAALVSARALGLLLYARGTDVGYGMESDLYEAVVDDVQPRGRIAASERSDDATPTPRRAITLEEMPVPQLSPDQSIAAHLARRRFEDAWRVYETYGGANASWVLEARTHIAMGIQLETRGASEQALIAFRAANQQDPDDAEALLWIGRLCADKCNDPLGAEHAFRLLMRKHPGSPEAADAEERLRNLASLSRATGLSR